MNAYEFLSSAGVSPTPFRERFLALPERFRWVLESAEVTSDGCWEWTGTVSPKGYGRAHQKQAHRLAYSWLVGPIPDTYDLHHRPTCPKRCINPEHVTPLLHEEHSAISNLGVKREPMTHCLQGHEFTPENTITSNGKRRCRTCDNQCQRDAYRKTHAPRKLKTHCKNGHELTSDNTYIYQRWGNEQRACHACRMAAVHRYQKKAA